MVSRDRSHVYTPIFGFENDSGGGNGASVKAGDHRYLLAVCLVSGVAGSRAQFHVEDSADDSSWAAVGTPAVAPIVGITTMRLVVIDRNYVRQWARIRWSIDNNAPAVGIGYLKVENLETALTSAVNTDVLVDGVTLVGADQVAP